MCPMSQGTPWWSYKDNIVCIGQDINKKSTYIAANPWRNNFLQQVPYVEVQTATTVAVPVTLAMLTRTVQTAKGATHTLPCTISKSKKTDILLLLLCLLTEKVEIYEDYTANPVVFLIFISTLPLSLLSLGLVHMFCLRRLVTTFVYVFNCCFILCVKT